MQSFLSLLPVLPCAQPPLPACRAEMREQWAAYSLLPSELKITNFCLCYLREREIGSVCMCTRVGCVCACTHAQVSSINSAMPQGIILALTSLNFQDHPYCPHIFRLSNQPSSSNKMTSYFSPLCVFSLLPESQVWDSLSQAVIQ